MTSRLCVFNITYVCQCYKYIGFIILLFYSIVITTNRVKTRVTWSFRNVTLQNHIIMSLSPYSLQNKLVSYIQFSRNQPISTPMMPMHLTKNLYLKLDIFYYFVLLKILKKKTLMNDLIFVCAKFHKN